MRVALPPFVLAGIFCMVANISSTAIAQDDPNIDQPVYDTPPLFDRGIGSSTLNVITSEEGYDNFDLGVDGAEPHMATNPLNPLAFYTAFNTNSGHWTIDGHDWTDVVPSFPSQRGDPVAAYDTLGNLYYTTMEGAVSIIGSWVVKSTDNGASWSTAVHAISGRDKQWLAADQTTGPYSGYVYITMTGISTNTGPFARSTDGGASWTTTHTFTTQTLPGMMVAVGPNVIGGDVPGGCVYVVTNSGSSTASTYTFYRSTDGGVTFSLMSSQIFANYVGTFVGGRNSVENSRTRPYPFIAADNSPGPYRGRLYLVYASNDPVGDGNKPDIWSRYSDDQGATWSGPVRVNDDINPQDNHQWTPAIWCDITTGRLYAKWYDTRESSFDDSTDVYASYSDDGGVTWAENHKLTTERFKIDCAGCGGGGTPRYQGDYDAITSNEYAAMAVWTDFRNNNFMSTTAYYPDFAMLISADADTVQTTGDLDVMVTIPSVKGYEHDVTFSASVVPSAAFSFNFPGGTTLSTFPDSLAVEISWTGVPEDSYTVTIQGEGPNGTPVHRRQIQLLVTSPFVDVVQPDGGEGLYTGTTYPIVWIDGLVDTVKIEYSTDDGGTWITVADSIQSRTINPDPPKARVKRGLTVPSESVSGTYQWVVPFTPSDICRVRVSHYNDGAITGMSDETFSILSAPAPAWRPQTSPSANDLYTVAVYDTSIAWAAGLGGTVVKTLNGGTTWTSTIGSAGDDVYNIAVVSPSVVLVATYNSGSGLARIRRTQNGGLTWSDVYSNSSAGAFINAITMFDNLNGYAQGDPVAGNWTLLKTTDGGLTWSSAATLPQAGGEAGWNNSMAFSDSAHGWFGTGNSRVYYTNDGGATWSSGSTPFVNSFGVGFEGDNATGFAGGEGGALSVDGGATWNSTSATPTGTVSAVSVADVDVFIGNRTPVWYTVNGSSIYKTDDQGASYDLDYSQANQYNHIDLTISELDGNYWLTGFAVGNGGTITRYTELLILTDVQQVSDLIPATYQLGQNYPNPFNPSTTIRYDLPGQSTVSLSIYNVLGQAVRTLVSEDQNAGSYEAVWDGRNTAGEAVSSGVYFYRLMATSAEGGEFVNMKKMLMMK